jgi:hypothetical protein
MSSGEKYTTEQVRKYASQVYMSTLKLGVSISCGLRKYSDGTKWGRWFSSGKI